MHAGAMARGVLNKCVCGAADMLTDNLSEEASPVSPQSPPGYPTPPGGFRPWPSSVGSPLAQTAGSVAYNSDDDDEAATVIQRVARGWMERKKRRRNNMRRGSPSRRIGDRSPRREHNPEVH